MSIETIHSTRISVATRETPYSLRAYFLYIRVFLSLASLLKRATKPSFITYCFATGKQSAFLSSEFARPFHTGTTPWTNINQKFPVSTTLAPALPLGPRASYKHTNRAQARNWQPQETNHHTQPSHTPLRSTSPFRFLPLSKKRGLWSSTTRKKHSTSAHSAHRPTCACSCDKAANHFTQIKFVARSPRRPKPKIVYQETRNAPGTTSRLAGRIEPSAVDKVENSCS